MNIHPIDGLIKNSRGESLAKALTWRLFAALITGSIVYVYTGELKQTGKIVLTAEIILTLAYYMHERVWIRIEEKNWIQLRK